jgi:hypothetical protein
MYTLQKKNRDYSLNDEQNFTKFLWYASGEGTRYNIQFFYLINFSVLLVALSENRSESASRRCGCSNLSKIAAIVMKLLHYFTHQNSLDVVVVQRVSMYGLSCMRYFVKSTKTVITPSIMI